MAYINVAEWSPDQVTDWLKGLDDCMYFYVKSFTNNEVKGQQLLNIRPYELEQLGMQTIGHQEIVLEAVEHLRNFHYHLDKENLQFLALRVATTAQCLCNQLAHSDDKSKIETQILSDITRMIATIKPLIGWLDRTPFQGKHQFYEVRNKMLRYAIEMATSAQRDRFVENPVEQIKQTALRVAKLANYIIQDVSDPMILQPAWLNLVTIKKKESELGFNIVPSYHGIHIVTDIKYNSPAHTSGKIEDGDEIIQINYQTVVGWQLKKVIDQLQESSPDILITLKKRPKHTKIYGQIYMKPYRLPSKKKAIPYRWGDTLPSPRTIDLQQGHTEFPTPPSTLLPIQPSLPRVVEKHTSSDSDCSDILTPTAQKCSDKDLRLYLSKPRAVLQRRNTICGDQSVLGFKNNVKFWHERFTRDTADDSPSLRDKSISFGFGLEIAPRPTTCLGIGSSPGGVAKFTEFAGALKGSLPEIQLDKCKHKAADGSKNDRHDVQCLTNDNHEEMSKPGISKVVRFDSNKDVYEYKDSKYSCNVDNTILEVFEPIPYVDEEDLANGGSTKSSTVNVSDKVLPLSRVAKVSAVKPPVMKRVAQRNAIDNNLVEAVNDVLVKDERFERSASVSAYDDTTDTGRDEDEDDSDDESDDDFDLPPPVIKSRKEFLHKTPPAPPPRPRRSIDPPIPTAVPTTNAVTESRQPQANDTTAVKDAESAKSTNPAPTVAVPFVPVSASSPFASPTLSVSKIPATRHFLEECELELLTPNKAKNLTLKKKNSIMAKRRKVSLKSLEMSDIQGHLYRRSKDKYGVLLWAKLYFVLADTSLYGFKSKYSTKANCLIFLPGFTVSLATEVHSKSFAFKVYHPTKTFYFAAESQQALAQWIEYIRQATIKGNTNTLKCASVAQNVKDLFSETESSDDELELSGNGKQLATPSPVTSGSRSNSGKKNNSSANDGETPKSEKYHLGFGSLKKFTKNSLQFSSSKADKEKKATSSDVPVPTAQFRSYRKVPGNAGLQLGTNSMISSTGASDFVPPVLSNTPDNGYKPEIIQQVPSPPQPAATAAATSTPIIAFTPPSDLPMHFGGFLKAHHTRMMQPKMKKLRKTSPYNYIHASNPNLVEFDFPTSKTLDYSFPKVNPSNSWDAHHNLQGFVTLKDLMLQKQEEDAQEMYNNRVYLGVEKKSSATNAANVGVAAAGTDAKSSAGKRKHRRTAHAASHLAPLSLSNDRHQAQNFNKIQSRSLPKTPDYAQSFKPDDSDIIMTRSREGQKLRDFGYEFISGDDPIDKSGGAKDGATPRSRGSGIGDGRTTNTAATSSTRKINAALTWISSATAATDRKPDGDDKSITSRSSSFKKSKNKLVADTFESFKTSSERLFQFKYTSNADRDAITVSLTSKTSGEKVTGLKAATTFVPLTLQPLNKKTTCASNGAGSAFVYGAPTDNSGGVATSSNATPAACSLKKSNTCNAPDFQRDTSMMAVRKNSAPERSASYFTKLTFSSTKPAKEKRLLGSPRLHRAIFGRRDSETQPVDHEVFSPLEFKPRTSSTSTTATGSVGTPETPDASTTSSQHHLHQHYSAHKLSLSTSAHTIGSPDYPNLEYPPVFEAETYSLSDPHMTLLRRRNHNQSK